MTPKEIFDIGYTMGHNWRIKMDSADFHDFLYDEWTWEIPSKQNKVSEGKMMCKDCDGCANWERLYLNWVCRGHTLDITTIERCPWPSKRVEKKIYPYIAGTFRGVQIKAIEDGLEENQKIILTETNLKTLRSALTSLNIFYPLKES